MAVALRKESVDRNKLFYFFITFTDIVALRKESVDRNLKVLGTSDCCVRRSPQGERG